MTPNLVPALYRIDAVGRQKTTTNAASIRANNMRTCLFEHISHVTHFTETSIVYKGQEEELQRMIDIY